MKNLKRIIITGDAGRGKSTLAEKISKKLSLPHYSTDDFFYEHKFFSVRDRAKALEMISELYHHDRWIVEGTTAWLLDPGMDRADLIIHLTYENILIQWYQLFKRYLRRENDTLKGVLTLMRHVFYKRYGLGYKKGKMTHEEFLMPYKSKIVVLSSFRQIEDFLESFK